MKKPALRREFWSKLVKEVCAGSAVEEVAKRHGVRPKTLSWWRWQLGRAHHALKPARWIPISVREPATSRATAPSPLCVVLPGCELRVGIGTDPSYVGKLVASLRAC